MRGRVHARGASPEPLLVRSVECIITAEVAKPFPDRPTDGTFSFEVVMSPMADASFPKEAWSPEAVETCRVMERALRESDAIETESLCILAGAFGELRGAPVFSACLTGRAHSVGNPRCGARVGQRR